MSEKNYEIGQLVKVLLKGDQDIVGIVSKPITELNPGHVLIHQEGCILGKDVSLEEIEPAGETDEGFAQLGYFLIKLGSHVIEKKLLVYRS